MKRVLDAGYMIVRFEEESTSKHIRISCSTDRSRSRFLFLIYQVEKPSTQKYVVGIGNNVFIVFFSVIIGRSVIINIPKMDELNVRQILNFVNDQIEVPKVVRV